MKENVAILLKRPANLVIIAGIALLTASLMFASRRSHESVAKISARQVPELIAGPGRVEPYSEDIKIGSELSGRLKSVNVEEGDAIHREQVLAEVRRRWRERDSTPFLPGFTGPRG